MAEFLGDLTVLAAAAMAAWGSLLLRRGSDGNVAATCSTGGAGRRAGIAAMRPGTASGGVLFHDNHRQ